GHHTPVLCRRLKSERSNSRSLAGTCSHASAQSWNRICFARRPRRISSAGVGERVLACLFARTRLTSGVLHVPSPRLCFVGLQSLENTRSMVGRYRGRS